MRVRQTRPALKDLDDIENYIALDDSGRAADFIDKLIDLGESLEFDWERGTQVKWTKDTRIREIYYHNYTISCPEAAFLFSIYKTIATSSTIHINAHTNPAFPIL